MTVEYFMRISRLTVDKLGVKLYDKVSAVIAELIANAYDADATEVTVEAPMGQFLASRAGGGITETGFEVRVCDNGIGMTPQEVQDFFLVVGGERRADPRRGDTSPHFRRKVMGRKGVGKLSPFGICRTIEVISSGGERISETDDNGARDGYRTSHIVLEYDVIVALGTEPDERYKPIVGKDDQSLSSTSGTRIILRNFNYRKVPDMEALGRQISQRFGIRSSDWQVKLLDNTICEGEAKEIGEFDIDTMPNTRLIFSTDGSVIGTDGAVEEGLKAGFDHEKKFFAVGGWMAYSKLPYSDQLMAGVRIYCRGKIAAQTHVFDQRAGFTGEHNIRSYLVGELQADWLDEDEDLIQTDRRDILWSDEVASAFQRWGQSMVKRIGKLSRHPMRKRTLEVFFETGNVDERLAQAYPREDHLAIRERAAEFAKSFGRTISRDEAEDTSVVGELVDLSIMLAPHVTLNSMMKEAIEAAEEPLRMLIAFLRTARLAELSSFGRVAEDRLKVVSKLEFLKDSKNTEEKELQQLITDAPWLINPEWAPVTQNQRLTTLRREFEKYYEKKTGESICLSDFSETLRRPDFVLSSQDGKVQIIEIKKPQHSLSNGEMERIVSYHDNMKSFLEDPAHKEFRNHYSDFHLTVVCDGMTLSGTHRAAFEGYESRGKLTRMNWTAFLLKTEQVHQDFLLEAARQRDAGPIVPKDD